MKKPKYPENARSAFCCGARDVFQASRAGGYEWCDCGLSGAHLVHYWAYGCEKHQQFLGNLGNTGRYCPGNCEWSKESEK